MAEMPAKPAMGLRPTSKMMSRASILIFGIPSRTHAREDFGVGANVRKSRKFR
jgi:hypothetical protein